MKRTLSVLLTAAMLLVTAPPSAFATETYPDDPVDQIVDPDEKPDRAAVERIVRSFLRDELRFNDAVTSGILANLYVECRFDISDRYVESGGFTSYGLCQWNRDRLQALIDFCAQRGYEPNQLEGQLQYMKYELETTEKNAYNKLRALPNDITGAYDAGLAWAQYFERSSLDGRKGRAELARDKFWPTYGRYLPVSLNVPYFSALDGEALSACYAMIEGYFAGYSDGDPRVTQGLDLSAASERYTELPADAETLFAALHTGIPVILKVPGKNPVLVYGYDGESDVLEAEGFRTLIPTPSAAPMPASFGHTDSGLPEGSTLLIRADLAADLPICTDGADSLTLSGYAHPVNLPAGASVRLGGRLTGPGTVAKVSLTLTDADGNLLAESHAEPGTAVYDLAELPALTGADALKAGVTGRLTLTVEDDQGATLTLSDPLTRSEMPLSGRVGRSGPDPLTTEDARVPGVYRVNTTSGLNIRPDPSTKHDRLVAVGNKTELTVTALSEDGLWGRVDYNGREGWICLEYTEFVRSLSYTLSYDANGGTTAPDATLVKEGQDLYLSEEIPARTGYRFMGWSENPLSQVGEYHPGDPYIGKFGATLYAVWAKIEAAYGDVSGDGLVNMRDIVLFQQHLNGYSVVLDYTAADLDGDGTLSMQDIARLQRYLNGYVD